MDQFKVKQILVILRWKLLKQPIGLQIVYNLFEDLRISVQVDLAVFILFVLNMLEQLCVFDQVGIQSHGDIAHNYID